MNTNLVELGSEKRHRSHLNDYETALFREESTGCHGVASQHVPDRQKGVVVGQLSSSAENYDGMD
jgi:hypothetical protein